MEMYIIYQSIYWSVILFVKPKKELNLLLSVLLGILEPF